MTIVVVIVVFSFFHSSALEVGLYFKNFIVSIVVFFNTHFQSSLGQTGILTSFFIIGIVTGTIIFTITFTSPFLFLQHGFSIGIQKIIHVHRVLARMVIVLSDARFSESKSHHGGIFQTTARTICPFFRKIEQIVTPRIFQFEIGNEPIIIELSLLFFAVALLDQMSLLQQTLTSLGICCNATDLRSQECHTQTHDKEANHDGVCPSLMSCHSSQVNSGVTD
mmetsp:Transcript_21616/g.45116  ORF Transcript_21616/g.45116 Transcript_21616/m.45116 type:complete len:222 (-) Transcript_21616:33-698(-)